MCLNEIKDDGTAKSIINQLKIFTPETLGIWKSGSPGNPPQTSESYMWRYPPLQLFTQYVIPMSKPGVRWTILREDFFQVDIKEQARAIIHEAYRRATRDISDKDVYSYSGDVMDCIRDCLEKGWTAQNPYCKLPRVKPPDVSKEWQGDTDVPLVPAR